MDAVIDLTARAVSFVTLVQDTITSGTVTSKSPSLEKGLFDTLALFSKNCKRYLDKDERLATELLEKAQELVWVSHESPAEDLNNAIIDYTMKLSTSVIQWILSHQGTDVFKRLEDCESFPAPFTWREVISQILYSSPGQRSILAKQLQYLPIQVVLAAGGAGYNAFQQRLLQLYKVDEEDWAAVTTSLEREAIAHCKNFHPELVDQLLINDDRLYTSLLNHKVPLSFDLVFAQELIEIEKNRLARYNEQCLKVAGDKVKDRRLTHVESAGTTGTSTLKKGNSMGLYALALSGGGIRSATFNLGILQSLAKAGLISRFDYLSTVSGGGYIGSWLEAWIKRDGSVTKVCDRLNADKSADPLAEEVRPIRWLRMFSNYFTPQTGLMSADSWTVGVTWMRNMILNQLVILLAFLAVFFLASFFYAIWGNYIKWGNTNWVFVMCWSIGVLLPAAFLAGLGMKSYYSERLSPLPIKRDKPLFISMTILLLGFAGAFFVSAAMFSNSQPSPANIFHFDSSHKFYLHILTLLPSAVIAFITLLLVAILGEYDVYMKDFKFNKFLAWTLIMVSSGASALIGLLSLSLVWVLLQTLACYPHDLDLYRNIAFTIGPPLILEVFCIVVVARMAFFGKYFPDERREWWGRLGGIVHRAGFIWMVVFGFSLLGRRAFVEIFHENFTLALGGWSAIIGFAVKAAASSKTNGKESTGLMPTFLNILAKTGPYLFIMGIFIFFPALIETIVSHKKEFIETFILNKHKLLILLGLAVGTAGLAFGFSAMVGVNEFSMHHFYRNRLVRAYLGATRRRTERERTSNAFTGFDLGDDMFLSQLTNAQGYFGPYPILNTTLNASQATDLDRQDRKAESFVFSPLFCGFDFSQTVPSANVKMKSHDYGYRPTSEYTGDKGPTLGTAMAISGAALNPNQGYHSSPGTAFLLTIFNAAFGWWTSNPRNSCWDHAEPKSGLAYLIYDLIGQTNTIKDFVCLSDGGHFDNMGLYELVRRRCSFIVLGDSEQDTSFSCEGLASAIRRCRIDFGAEIEIDIHGLVQRNEKNFSAKNYALGTIKYPGEIAGSGHLLYIKASMTEGVSVDVREYALKHPTFPDQTTADQFFDEEQFESYRKLGLYIGDLAMADAEVVATFRF
ncbi:MAG: patatin-like phospholipase family protein [Chitinophagaceae bacterium]